MMYAVVIQSALDYADREDDEVIDKMDTFLRIVESRINKALEVGDMSVRSTITTIDGQEYYALPDDFGGLRDIEIKEDADSTDRQTPEYLSPAQMNAHAADTSGSVNYTIIANQIQIYPPQDGSVLEIVYYQRLVGLDSTNTENWVSAANPDAYIFGLLVEISAFVKNVDALSIWEGRFKQSLSEITDKDRRIRWSGNPLTVSRGA